MFFITWHYCKLSVYCINFRPSKSLLYNMYMLHIVLISESVQWTFIKRHTSPRGTTYEDAMLTMWFFVWGHDISDLRVCWSLVSQMKEVFLPPVPQGPAEELMSGSVSPLGASCSDGYVYKKRAALAHTGVKSEHIRQQLIAGPVSTEIVDQLCLCTCVLM